MKEFSEFSRAFTEAALSIPHFDEALEVSRETARKCSGIAIMAARRKAAISGEWASETLESMGKVSRTRPNGGYAKAASEFATETTESFSKLVGAYGDLVMSVQSEAIQQFLNVGSSEDQEPPLSKPYAEAGPGEPEERSE